MSVHEEILARTKELYEKFNSGDIDGMVAMYKENAILYLQNHNPIVGRADIKASIAKIELKRMELDKEEFYEEFNDTTVYALGFTRGLNAAGETVAMYKGSLLWRKIDGNWLIEHDIFNDMPI